MADSQQNQKSTHLGVLEEALHPRVVAALDGRIREVANEEIDKRLSELTATVNDLADQQRAQIAAFKDLAPQQQREVVDDVNDSTDATRRAVQGQSDLAERQRSGEEVSSEELQQVEADTADAEQKQASADRKLAAATRVREEHEAQQAERTDHSKSDPAPAPSRETSKDKRQVKGDLDYATKGDLASLSARVDQIGAESRDAKVAAARAIAIARASAGSLAPMRRATTWAMIAFVVVAVLYLLITGLTPLEHVWRDNFAWAFGVAFIAFCAGVITAKDDSATAEASSEARADHRDDNAGLDIVDRRDRDEHRHDQYPGSSRSPRATADARSHASAQ